jgi:hypothetical protein
MELPGRLELPADLDPGLYIVELSTPAEQHYLRFVKE